VFFVIRVLGVSELFGVICLFGLWDTCSTRAVFDFFCFFDLLKPEMLMSMIVVTGVRKMDIYSRKSQNTPLFGYRLGRGGRGQAELMLKEWESGGSGWVLEAGATLAYFDRSQRGLSWIRSGIVMVARGLIALLMALMLRVGRQTDAESSFVNGQLSSYHL
jgi:hypothetical protein